MTKLQMEILDTLQRIDATHDRAPKLFPVILLTLSTIVLSVGAIAAL